MSLASVAGRSFLLSQAHILSRPEVTERFREQGAAFHALSEDTLRRGKTAVFDDGPGK